ncbi:MAG: hypothetical protein Q9165_004299 [Trypethelium subeluteriae]
MDQKQGQRISAGLFNIYLNYKHDTKAIIGWLIDHGNSRYDAPKALAIKDLVALASVVQEKAIRMPDLIHFQFQQAIKARGHLSKCFRKDDLHGANEQSTCDHEFFTASLKKIYTGLCEHCGKPKGRSDDISCNATSKEVRDTKAHNRFSSFESDHIETQDLADVIETDLPLESRPKDSDGETTLTIPMLADDVLGQLFELCEEVQAIQDLYSVFMATWELAGQGKLPCFVAALVSHAAFAEFERVSHRLRISCDIADPQVLEERFTQMSEMSCEDKRNTELQKIVEVLNKSWQQLLDLKSKPSKELSEQITSRARAPQILRAGDHSAAMDDDCVARMLEDLYRHTSSHTMSIIFHRVGSPVWPDVGYFLTHGNEESDGFRCSFGLQLLLKSLKSYVFAAEPKIPPSACRLQALRFAQEAIPSIGAVLDNPTMPCRCPNTLAFHLEQLQTELQHFLGVKQFDLYFQSPWVSGSHMVEIADALFYYGLRLISYRSFVGSLLHIYNALRYFDFIEPVAMFDSVSQALGHILFPGGRPSQNFKACYMRHMGGRLSFCSDKHDSGCHSMVIPPHTAWATAGFGLPTGNEDPRFDYKKTSLIFHLKEQDFLLQNGTWTQMVGIVSKKSPTTDKQSSHESTKTRPDYHHRSAALPSCPRQKLRTLREALSRDFNHPLCTARINFFQVYLACMRIVSRISNKHHGDEATLRQRCLCFVQEFLVAADECRGNEKRLKKRCSKGLVDICKTAIVEEVRDAKIEDFLWKTI